MKEFFKKIKGFIFIYLALVLILGLGLNFLSFSAKAQEFHLDIETQRWENATTHKFRDNAILENKICNTGENDCQGISVSKFSNRFDTREGRQGTTAKLGQFLKWKEDNNLWFPYSIRGVNFRGKWNIVTQSDLLSSSRGSQQSAGDYFVVDVEGTPDPNIETCRYDEYTQRESCDDDTVWRKGDWAIWNGQNWNKISYTGKIESLFGRGGLVRHLKNDYTWDQVDKDVSVLRDLTDVSRREEEEGDILIWRKHPEKESFWWLPESKKITSEMIEDNDVITSKIKDGGINTSFGEMGENSLKDSAIITTKFAEGSVETKNISDEAITTKTMEDSAFTTPKLDDGAVTNETMSDSLAVTVKIKNEAVASGKIKDGAVLEEKIMDGAIITEKILNDAVITKKIKNDGVTSSDLQNGVISTDIIPDQSVVTGKIANGAVINSKIKNGDVIIVKIGTSAVTTPKIPDAAILTSKLVKNAVATGKVADSAVISSKIKKGDVITAKIANNAVTTTKIPDGAIVASKLTNEAVTTDKLIDGAVTIPKIVDGAVTQEKFEVNSVITTKIPDNAVTSQSVANEAVTTEKIVNANITTLKLADKGVTSEKVATSSITTPKIADSGITPNQLANGAVVADKIVNAGIITSKIADGNVIPAKLGGGSVTTAKIPDGHITTTKLANGAVALEKIADGGVITSKIADGNVTSAKLKAGSVTTVKIPDNGITTNKLGNGQVVADAIANGGITTSKIPDRAVTSTKLAAGSVTTAKIPDGGITPNKLANEVVSLEKIPNESIIPVKIADGNVTSAKLASGSVTASKIPDGGVTPIKVADGAVTTDKIADSAITVPKIDEEAVTTAKVKNSAVTASKIPDGAVTTSKLNFDAITTDKIANSAVTIPKIAQNAVTSIKLGTSAVTSAKIADGAVTTNKLSNTAVTTAKIANGTLGNADFSSIGSVSRSKVQAGTAGSIVYNNDSTGKLDQESSLAIKRGGTAALTSQNARSALGIRPGADINTHHARLDDIKEMGMDAGDMLLGGDQNYKLALRNSSEVRSSFEIGSSSQFKVLSNGNVGISQSPSKKLDVNGDSKFRDDLNVDGNKIKNIMSKPINTGSSSKCAELYLHDNYNGTKWSFCPGSPLPNFNWKGESSSLKVPSGGTVKLCWVEDGTVCDTYTSNTSFFSGYNDNDRYTYLDYTIDGARIISGSGDYAKDLLSKKDANGMLSGRSFANSGIKYFSYLAHPSTSNSWSDCKKSKPDAATVCGSTCPAGKKCFVGDYRYGFNGPNECPNNTAPTPICRHMCYKNGSWNYWDTCTSSSESRCLSAGCTKTGSRKSCKIGGGYYRFQFDRTHQYYCYQLGGNRKGKTANNSPIFDTTSGVELANTFGGSVSWNSSGEVEIATASQDHFYKIKVHGVCNNVNGISSSSKCELELRLRMGRESDSGKVAETTVGMNSQFQMEYYIQLPKSYTWLFTVFNTSGGQRYLTDVHYTLIRLK